MTTAARPASSPRLAEQAAVQVSAARSGAPSKENTVSYPRKSVEFRAQMTRIEETAAKGGAHLRSAHAMDKRLTAAVKDACAAAGVELPHQWMRTQDMVALLEAAEEANEEAVARRILAAEQDATAAKLEKQGGPRRLARAENLREHARLHRLQADQAEAAAGQPHRLDVVAEVVFRTPAGEFAVQIRREDVTGTNGAYQAARDAAQEMVAFELKSMLLSHREGRELPALRPFKK
jgi:hypothetical protein